MTDPSLRQAVGPWMAILSPDGDPFRWSATVAGLSQACDTVVLLTQGRAATEATETFKCFPNVRVSTSNLAQEVQQHADAVRAFLIVSSPAVLPADAVARADVIIENDPRIATVSFFCNDADYLTLPERNRPQVLLPAGFSETSATSLLRSETSLDRSVPIPVPAGPAVAVTGTAVRSLGTLPGRSLDYSLLEFGLRASRRSMRNVLEPSTLVFRIAGEREAPDALSDPATIAALHSKYRFFPGGYEDAKAEDESALACAIRVGRATLLGLSILIDATTLGPFETGTQVQTLNLVQALARHSGVRRVLVGLVGRPPPYAVNYLQDPKIETVYSGDCRFPTTDRVDILHRPFQPDGKLPWDFWREIAHRVVITVQDLIAYNNGSYYSDAADWMRYRSGMRDSMASADGVVVISDDVANDLSIEQMPVPSELMRVIPNGVDHSLTDAPEAVPPMVLANGFAASPYVLVLGTSYAHKNRDHAIAAWRLLRSRGYPEKLVLVGVTVPFGSTRNEEAHQQASLGVDQRREMLILPDVTSGERVWLLKHASVVLYPTSAEGFGLVPFEAAQCGTPTAFVSFGPLADLLSSVPVTARDWSPAALADAVAQLLDDPATSQAQVESVKALSGKYSWDDTANEAVHFYRQLLARPPMKRMLNLEDAG